MFELSTEDRRRVSRQGSMPVRLYSTVDAHTLVRHAEGKGTARDLADAIFTAYFLDEPHIADRDVLVSIAERHDFTEQEAITLLCNEDERRLTRDEAERTVQAGVTGVPLYVINERERVSGAQRVSVFREAIERALATVA